MLHPQATGCPSRLLSCRCHLLSPWSQPRAGSMMLQHFDWRFPDDSSAGFLILLGIHTHSSRDAHLHLTPFAPILHAAHLVLSTHGGISLLPPDTPCLFALHLAAPLMSHMMTQSPPHSHPPMSPASPSLVTWWGAGVVRSLESFPERGSEPLNAGC